MTVTLRPTTALISGMAATIGEPGVVEAEVRLRGPANMPV